LDAGLNQQIKKSVSLSLSAANPGAQVLASPNTRSLRDLVLLGSATLGVAMVLERALGFISNMLAARISGPQTFGAYSVVLATAGTVAAYAGAGLGTTAIRFSGQYPRESAGYRKFLATIVGISLMSAIISALLMLTGASFLGRLVLRNEALTPILRIAAISSAAIILFECCRGLLIGQQKFRSQLVLSAVLGAGLIIVLPLAARISATAMIAGQAGVAMAGVGVCVIFAKRLGVSPLSPKTNIGPKVYPILRFGLVQFGAFAGVSLASWWVALLVARSDATLTQMGLYAIANQFRGLAAIAPALCAQVGYSLLTDESGAQFGGADRVMLTNSLLSTALATMIAGLAIITAPWLLLLVYGRSFTGAEGPVLILLATGVIHMSGGPAMQRLSIVRLRALAVINALWAVLVVLLGLWFVPKWGATGAALAFLISHAISDLLVMVSLARLGKLQEGYFALMAVLVTGTLSLALLGYWRAMIVPYSLPLTVLLTATWMIILILLWQISSINGVSLRLQEKRLLFR
jgi:O-antigen/teichoic acid export membrane protein